jgi:hypothetical protein
MVNRLVLTTMTEYFVTPRGVTVEVHRHLGDDHKLGAVAHAVIVLAAGAPLATALMENLTERLDIRGNRNGSGRDLSSPSSSVRVSPGQQPCRKRRGP